MGLKLLRTSNLLNALSVFDDDVDCVHWRYRGRDFFGTRSPLHLHQVLVERQDRYEKSASYRLIEGIAGGGLLTSDGARWSRSRRLMQPTFSAGSAVLAREIVAAADEALDASVKALPDTRELLARITLDAVGRAILGCSLASENSTLSPAVSSVLQFEASMARLQLVAALSNDSIDRLVRLLDKRWVKRVVCPNTARAVDVIRSLSARVVGGRPERTDHGDVVTALLAAAASPDRAISPADVEAEVTTLILAGHETTATSLCWLLSLLATNASAKERFYEEVDSVLGCRRPEARDLDALPFVSACVRESLRLFPPVWIVEREAVSEDRLGGAEVQPGATIIMPIYLVHRDNRWWSDPDSFLPERFFDSERRRGTYLPFGAGRRTCIGASFAMLEATLISAVIAQRFDLVHNGMAFPTPLPTLTLRPGGPLPFSLRRR